MNSIAEC